MKKIKKKHIDLVYKILVKLEDEVEMLKEHAENLDFKIESLTESVLELNETLVETTPTTLAQLASDYGESVTRHISVYRQWLKRQLSENLGECQVRD